MGAANKARPRDTLILHPPLMSRVLRCSILLSNPRPTRILVASDCGPEVGTEQEGQRKRQADSAGIQDEGAKETAVNPPLPLLMHGFFVKERTNGAVTAATEEAV